MRREILTCYLDFNVTEDFDATNGLSLAELKTHVGLVAEFADILSKFLVADLIRSRCVQNYIEAKVDVTSLLEGVVAINLCWKYGLGIVDADVLTNELVNMCRDAIEFLVIERCITNLTYEIDAGVDCLYKFVVLEDSVICKFQSEEMALLVNRIEGQLVKLNTHGINVELHVCSFIDSFQVPPLEHRRHFLDIKHSDEEVVECMTFAHEMRGENKVFKITLTGKTGQYYLDDVNSEDEDYLARRARYADKLRLRVRPVRSVKRGVLGPITRYIFVAWLNEKDEGQMTFRFIDKDGRRKNK